LRHHYSNSNRRCLRPTIRRTSMQRRAWRRAKPKSDQPPKSKRASWGFDGDTPLAPWPAPALNSPSKTRILNSSASIQPSTPGPGRPGPCRRCRSNATSAKRARAASRARPVQTRESL
jgi:hypothetical protein